MRDEAIGIIVLAAGASVRMGTPKQLIRVGGISLLRRSVLSALTAGCQPVVVVLGANAEPIRHEITDLWACAVTNPEWETGMASSIRCGLTTALRINPEVSGVILMVGDQPEITATSLERLIGTYSRDRRKVVAARYNQVTGTPALFPRRLFSELLLMEGSGGAKRVLDRHRDDVVCVDLPEAERDIDTPQDLAAYMALIDGHDGSRSRRADFASTGILHHETD